MKIKVAESSELYKSWPEGEMRRMQRSLPWEEPFYHTARGAADTTLVIQPPFSFPGVSARIFPLRASMNLLSGFLESSLNVAPPEVCELRPCLPFVLLVVLDYGRMAIESANMGWVSQNEIFFAVPLEKWRRDRPGGHATFQGLVLNTPFIFVDNPSSLTTGRECYGWPKILASLEPSLEEWLVDPRNPTRLLSLSVDDFGNLDNKKKKRQLLVIDQRLGQNPSLAPPDFNVMDPFEQLSRLSQGAWTAGRDIADLLFRPRLSGFGQETAGGRAEVLLDSLRQLIGFFREPGVDVVTLKQFRDSQYPSLSCYQALVQSRLGVGRYNRGGLLGLYNLLQGDPSGGFRIGIRDHSSLPIVESLGLEVARKQTVFGHSVSVLEPFFPFWMSVDLTYGRGTTLGWRMLGSPWFRKGREITHHPSEARYNTVAGAAKQEWCGPYVVPKASCKVFPLRADPETLLRFIDGYLNLGEPYHFTPWGRYVYMTVTTSRIFSQALSASACEIAFLVPLLWYEAGRFKSFALAKPFAFVDNPNLAMTLREVQGVPATDTTIETPSRSWLRGGPVLRMKADVFRALDAGLESKRRTLLEVVSDPGGGSSATPPSDPRLPGAPPLLDWSRQVACGQKPLPLRLLMLKQFRDAEEPDRACYQSLIREKWKVQVRNVEPLTPGMQVYVHRYPSLPLVDKLGLWSGRSGPAIKRKGAIVDVLTPDSPFTAELDISIDCGETISQTAGSLPWQPPHRAGTPPSRRQAPPATRQEEVREETELRDPAWLHEHLPFGPQPLIQALFGSSSLSPEDADSQA
jgi:hypothetical protein